MEKFYQLTNPDSLRFSESVAGHINKDYPGVASIRRVAGGYIVLLTMEYYERCKMYVQKNCKCITQ